MMKHWMSFFVQWSLLVVCMAGIAGELAAQEVGQQAHGIAREHYYQGVFQGKQGNYNEAILELEKAIQSDPAYADAYNALAVVYHRQKQYQKAIENYLLAIETNPRYVKARTNLAMIYHEQGQAQKALRQLEQALQDDPAYEPAQQLLETVRKKAQAQEAQERLQQQAQAAARASETPTAQPTPTPHNKANCETDAALCQGDLANAILAAIFIYRRDAIDQAGQTGCRHSRLSTSVTAHAAFLRGLQPCLDWLPAKKYHSDPRPRPGASRKLPL